jgi:hypothetical protein
MSAEKPVMADVEVIQPPTHAEHLVWIYQCEPGGSTFLLPVWGDQTPEHANQCKPNVSAFPEARMALVKVSVPLTELRYPR